MPVLKALLIGLNLLIAVIAITLVSRDAKAEHKAIYNLQYEEQVRAGMRIGIWTNSERGGIHTVNLTLDSIMKAGLQRKSYHY